MGGFDLSAKSGQEITFSYIKEVMKSKGITWVKLSELTGISRTTLHQNFKFETKMLLENYFKICGALELRPCLITADMDKNNMNVIDFN